DPLPIQVSGGRVQTTRVVKQKCGVIEAESLIVVGRRYRRRLHDDVTFARSIPDPSRDEAELVLAFLQFSVGQQEIRIRDERAGIASYAAQPFNACLERGQCFARKRPDQLRVGTQSLV